MRMQGRASEPTFLMRTSSLLISAMSMLKRSNSAWRRNDQSGAFQRVCAMSALHQAEHQATKVGRRRACAVACPLCPPSGKLPARLSCLWRMFRGCRSWAATARPFGEFLSRLEVADYKLDFRPIKLAKYGIPQSRRRLVLLASRHGPIRLPEETHGPGTPNEKYDTVRDWISHLPPIQAGEEHDKVSNHRAASLSARNMERVKSTPEGVVTGIGRKNLNSTATRAFPATVTSMVECHGTHPHPASPPAASATRTDVLATQTKIAPSVSARRPVCRPSPRTLCSREAWGRWQDRSAMRCQSDWRNWLDKPSWST